MADPTAGSIFGVHGMARVFYASQRVPPTMRLFLAPYDFSRGTIHHLPGLQDCTYVGCISPLHPLRFFEGSVRVLIISHCHVKCDHDDCIII